MTLESATKLDLSEVDEALQRDLNPPSSQKQTQEAQEGEKLHRLASILRTVAVVVLLTAAGTFLFQGWGGWSSVQRIFAFLGFTGALAGTGAISGLGYKDDKGARVALGVATAIIPVACSQIGGLVYSLFAKKLVGIPETLLFTAPSTLSVVATVGVAAALLTPIAFAGFSALARVEARNLTALFLCGNAALLIPTREPILLGLLAMALLVATTSADRLLFSQRLEMRTLEGHLSRGLMFVPLIIMITRNLMLYSLSTMLLSTVCAGIGALLFCIMPTTTSKNELGEAYQKMSVVPVGFAWAAFAHALFFEAGAFIRLSRDFQIPLTYLPIALILFSISFFAIGSGKYYRKLAAYVAVGSVVLELFTFPGMVSAFFCIVTSVLCLSAGCMLEERGLFHAGCVGMTIGVLYHLRFAIDIYNGLGPWMSMAFLGIAILLLSSYIEKNFRRLTVQVSHYREQIKSWD